MSDLLDQTAPRPPVDADDDDPLLSSAQARGRVGGVSVACLWRWTRDPEVLFPWPDAIIKGRRYWRASTIRAFNASRRTDGRIGHGFRVAAAAADGGAAD